MTRRQVLSFDWFLWFQWIMATTWGWLLGQFLFAGVYLAAAGVAVAALQWLVLRQKLNRAWRWALASAAGWALGYLLALALGRFEPSFLTGLLLGTTAGAAQWLILRREVHWAGWWIVLSAVGWSTGMSMALAPLLAGVPAGAVTGIALLLLLNAPKSPYHEQTSEDL